MAWQFASKPAVATTMRFFFLCTPVLAQMHLGELAGKLKFMSVVCFGLF